MKRRIRLGNGELGELEQIGTLESPEDKANRLEQEAAYLAYSDVQKDLRIQELETSQALLMYQLMQGGII